MSLLDVNSVQDAIPCFKYFLIAFNFIIWILGLALLSFAIIIRTDDGLYEFLKALEIDRYYTATYICMLLGVLLMIFGFIGCLGATIESPCLLIIYVLISITCIFLEISVCVNVWKNIDGDELQKELSEKIHEHILEYDNNEQSRRFLDLIQYKLTCCGATDFNNYHHAGLAYPQSCSNPVTNNVNIRSCGENLRRYLERRGGALGGISMSLVLMHIFSLGFNACLFFALHEAYNYRKFHHTP